MPIFARLKQKLHLVDHDDDTDSKDGEGGEEIPGSPSAAKDSTLGVHLDPNRSVQIVGDRHVQNQHGGYYKPLTSCSFV
jgi:hypothetical protein